MARPASPRGKARTTKAMLGDFRCVWTPVETAFVHTVRKFVPF